MPSNYEEYDPAKEAMQKATKAGDEPQSSAMSRALQKAYSQPPALVAQGLAHLNDPNNGLDYDTKMAAAQPLLEAKHFGGPNPNGQGQIRSAKEAKDGLGNLITANNAYNTGAAAIGKLGILNAGSAGTAWAGADAGASSIGELMMLA